VTVGQLNPRLFLVFVSDAQAESGFRFAMVSIHTEHCADAEPPRKEPHSSHKPRVPVRSWWGQDVIFAGKKLGECGRKASATRAKGGAISWCNLLDEV
jgi:hypothetical protein